MLRVEDCVLAVKEACAFPGFFVRLERGGHGRGRMRRLIRYRNGRRKGAMGITQATDVHFSCEFEQGAQLILQRQSGTPQFHPPDSATTEI